MLQLFNLLLRFGSSSTNALKRFMVLPKVHRSSHHRCLKTCFWIISLGTSVIDFVLVSILLVQSQIIVGVLVFIILVLLEIIVWVLVYILLVLVQIIVWVLV